MKPKILTRESESLNVACLNSTPNDNFCFRYKLVVAEALVEHIDPIRLKIDDYLKNPDYLCKILDDGNDRARETAVKTIDEVKLKVGLGHLNKFSKVK